MNESRILENGINQEESAFVDDQNQYNRKIKSIPRQPQEIGVDTKNTFFDNIINAGLNSKIDISEIESFTQASQNRNLIYDLLDTMCEDPTISAVLETYAEDATEYNDNGQIVWCESSNSDVASYVTYLLETMNVDKNIYKWVHSLCKYGDLYLRLYRESDYKDDPIFKDYNIDDDRSIYSKKDDKKALNEDIKVVAYSKNDKYVHYIEMCSNPAELFELTKFGKTHGYIKAESMTKAKTDNIQIPIYQYKFKQKDIEIFDAKTFVHACLEDNSSRIPEEVDIFLDDDKLNSDGSESSMNYTVKRGQSLFYNVFKIWRELMLLENSILLNRLTKSSITRVIGVEVGDMPKEQVGPHLQGIKNLIEQKSAINVGKSMTDYTNPGPIENNIYVPTHNGIGALSTQQVGGDVDVKSLADVDYFKNKFWGSVRIPKMYFGECLRGNTPILLLNGSTRTIEEMFNNKDDYIGKGIMACDTDGSLCPTKITNIVLTRPSSSFIRIHLDNGEYVDVTDNHRMMLRDGSFVRADEINIGDSLMPYYEKIKDGRRYVLDNKTGKYKPQYRVVAESVYNIPKGYQVHHINSIKINDDFDNLVPLTLREHWEKHIDSLHELNKLSCEKKRKLGIKHGNYGRFSITNGIENMWLKQGDKIPDGFHLGQTCYYSEDARERMAEGKRGLHNYKSGFAIEGEARQKAIDNSKKVKLERKNLGLYNEQYKKCSELMKLFAKEHKGWHSDEAKAKRLACHPENRVRKPHYVRCLCCGTIEKIKCNQDWYDDYLNENVFWFCSKECSKLNSGGKLGRSYRLYRDCEYDFEKYDFERWNGTSRPDTFLKIETLNNALSYINNYVPECNHTVINIEYIDVQEPAYDISVEADCHTFALPCGIFVHNCDDAAGFSGGESLSLISSRYAKMIKRIQNTIIQAITDAINLMLIDKGFNSYINQFTIKMQPPATAEERDRRENLSNKIGVVSDIMGLLDDVEDTTSKLKILKSLLSNVLTEPEVMDILQEEIDRLEDNEEILDNSDENDIDSENINFDLGGIDIDTSNNKSEQKNSEETNQESSEGELPSPEELGIDMTNNNNPEFD